MKNKEPLEAKLHENMRRSRLVTDYGLYNDFFFILHQDTWLKSQGQIFWCFLLQIK